MFIRQSIIRGGTASLDDVIGGLAAWVTVLFDLGNLQHDRARALDLRAAISDADVDRLSRAIAAARHGCILAVPHVGSLELFAACLKDRGFDPGFVYTIGRVPTPTEEWIARGRSAIGGTGIAFGRRTTGQAIGAILANKGVVIMVVDVYPSDRHKGIPVDIHGGVFNYPPGPARFARSGTLVLPGVASRRNEGGFAMSILDPIAYPAGLSPAEAGQRFTQTLAARIAEFTIRQPEGYWLWHPIPNDPFLKYARRQRPDLLRAPAMDDEAAALAVEAMGTTRPA